MPTLNSCTKRLGSLSIILIDTRLSGHTCRCIGDLTTERSFDSQATWVIDMLGLFFDMLSMDVCTIRHRQTSGRLVQELLGTELHYSHKDEFGLKHKQVYKIAKSLCCHVVWF